MGQQILTAFDVRIPMRDGVQLSAVIIRPADDGKYPVLLSRMPYGKDVAAGSGPADVMIDLANTAKSGYVIVLQDTRGRFLSEGNWDILPCMNGEDQDGYDTVQWLLKQPYCSGKIGTFGGSYLAYTQWKLMEQKIPEYQAAVPTVSFATPRDGFWYRGGALELGLYTVWAMGFQADTLTKMGLSGEQMTAAYGTLVYDMENLPERMKSLPLKDYAPFVDNKLPASALDIIRAGYADKEICKKQTIGENYREMSVPALCIGGWYDVFLNGTLQNFMGVREKADSIIAENTKLVVGPWSHWSRNEWLADGYFGMQGSAYGVDLYGMHNRWFDHFLKGIDNGIEKQAPVKLFIMGENVWRDEQEWPLARTQYTPFYLGSGGHANTSHGDGTLTREAVKDAGFDTYEYDPADPVETLGGTNLITPYYEVGPKDYRHIEGRQDVLVYTTEELVEDLEVTGPVRAKLWITSSAADTDFVVRLLDVHPDGASMVLTDGITRARYRDYEKTGQVTLLTPGEPTLIEVDLWATANCFKRGHKIRVEVTSSCFPRWDRNPNTGHELIEDEEKDFVVATQRILHDEEHPSQIVLPVIP